jgi:hypothetical protein
MRTDRELSVVVENNMTMTMVMKKKESVLLNN